jgi:hypothetical protein
MVLMMKISPDSLIKGKEIDITPPRSAPRNFRISIRYNETYRRFEVYRHYYRTKKNEVEYYSRNMEDVVDYIKSMYGVDFEIED